MSTGSSARSTWFKRRHNFDQKNLVEWLLIRLYDVVISYYKQTIDETNINSIFVICISSHFYPVW